MNINSELPNNPIFGWLASLFFPIINVCIIVLLFPIISTFLRDLTTGLIDYLLNEGGQAGGDKYGWLSRDEAAGVSSGGDNIIELIIAAVGDRLNIDVANAFSGIVSIGFIALIVLLYVIYFLFYFAAKALIGESDIVDEAIFRHRSLRCYPPLRRYQPKNGETPNPQTFLAEWAHRKMLCDSDDALISYHRQRDAISAEMKRHKMICSHSIWYIALSAVSILVIFLSFLYYSSTDKLDGETAALVQGAILGVLSIPFFALTFHVSSGRYITNCILLVKLDFGYSDFLAKPSGGDGQEARYRIDEVDREPWPLDFVQPAMGGLASPFFANVRNLILQYRHAARRRNTS